MLTKFVSSMSPFSCFAIVTAALGETIIWYSVMLLLVAGGALVLVLLQRRIQDRMLFLFGFSKKKVMTCILWARVALANFIVAVLTGRRREAK